MVAIKRILLLHIQSRNHTYVNMYIHINTSPKLSDEEEEEEENSSRQELLHIAFVHVNNVNCYYLYAHHNKYSPLLFILMYEFASNIWKTL